MNKKNSDAKIKANNKYTKNHYTQIMCRAKPNTAEEIKKYCDDFGISVNSFINMCCKYCMENVYIEELKQYK